MWPILNLESECYYIHITCSTRWSRALFAACRFQRARIYLHKLSSKPYNIKISLTLLLRIRRFRTHSTQFMHVYNAWNKFCDRINVNLWSEENQRKMFAWPTNYSAAEWPDKSDKLSKRKGNISYQTHGPPPPTRVSSSSTISFRFCCVPIFDFITSAFVFSSLTIFLKEIFLLIGFSMQGKINVMRQFAFFSLFYHPNN